MANSDVILRIASNSANGNSDPSGDHINTKEVMIPAALVKDKKLYFAHFGDGQKGPVQLFSQITVVSLDASSSINATAEIFDNDGDPLIVDLNGEVVPGKKDFVVPAGGSVVLKTDGKGMVQPGSVIVSSDAPLSGVILFGGSVGVAGMGSSQPLKKFRGTDGKGCGSGNQHGRGHHESGKRGSDAAGRAAGSDRVGHCHRESGRSALEAEWTRGSFSKRV